MAEIRWTTPAFSQLEALPEVLAFEVVDRVDVLATFPQMGSWVNSNAPELQNSRQLIVRRTYRIVYEYDERADAVYILAVQHCRQRLPTRRDLKRRRSDREE